MSSLVNTRLFQEEHAYIFSKKGHSVRGVFVVSALIEGQLFSLARRYLEARNVTFIPEPRQEYDFSLNVLRTNGVLKKGEIRDIQKFQEQRNLVVHTVFKGSQTRKAWEEQIQLVVDLGRPLVNMLDQKLLAEESI